MAIAGSFRSKSYNLSILLDARSHLSKNSDFDLFDQLHDITPFNPDQETPPYSVMILRSRIRSADAILVAHPEYVREIPGVLNNLLDWAMGSSE